MTQPNTLADILPTGKYNINGQVVTGAQIITAFFACGSLVRVYEIADNENGGNSKVDWDDIDDVVQEAHSALGPEQVAQAKADARIYNDFEETE